MAKTIVVMLWVGWATLVPASVYGEGNDATVVRLSEPVSQTLTTETFGQPIDWRLPRFALSQLVGLPKEHMGTSFLVEPRIAQVCQKRGCFFIAQDGNYSVRVAFRDYGFFRPTDSAGKTVTLSGELIERQMSEAQAAHYAADLGGTDVASGKVYEILADAVQVPR